MMKFKKNLSKCGLYYLRRRTRETWRVEDEEGGQTGLWVTVRTLKTEVGVMKMTVHKVMEINNHLQIICFRSI